MNIISRTHVKMKKAKNKKYFSRILKIIIKLIFFLICFTIAQVLVLKYINPPITPNVAWEWVESIIKKQPERKPQYKWRKIADISPHLGKAVMAAEDQRFLSHHGFDFNEMKNALKNGIKRKKIRGASTISMQTARSVFLISSRSIIRKIVEMYYTVLIELMWDKKRILEMYLNTVDWGTHVTGAEAASQKYFSKNAGHLTSAQAALMTAILPNPHKWSVKHPTPYLKARQRQIMKNMRLMSLPY